MPSIQLSNSWLSTLKPEFAKPYMRQLNSYLDERIDAGATIYPEMPAVFAALNKTDFQQVKVVILGQDPYHGPDQAHGLSFSVPEGIAIPPSLKNIYKEIKSDLGVSPPQHGYLGKWAEQGVLLLNSVLTVEKGAAGSHRKQGWEEFTDAVVNHLATERQGLVFILWGAYAWKKGAKIDQQKHLVLKAPHPSPLSAYRGFFGSKPFSRSNAYLEAHGQKPIVWA